MSVYTEEIIYKNWRHNWQLHSSVYYYQQYKDINKPNKHVIEFFF